METNQRRGGKSGDGGRAEFSRKNFLGNHLSRKNFLGPNFQEAFSRNNIQENIFQRDLKKEFSRNPHLDDPRSPTLTERTTFNFPQENHFQSPCRLCTRPKGPAIWITVTYFVAPQTVTSSFNVPHPPVLFDTPANHLAEFINSTLLSNFLII